MLKWYRKKTFLKPHTCIASITTQINLFLTKPITSFFFCFFLPHTLCKTALLRYNSHTMKRTHFKCIIVSSKFKELCIHHNNLVFNYFHHCTEIPHAHLQSVPVPSSNPRQPLIYFSFSIDLPFIDISYKQNHPYCVLCLPSSLKIMTSWGFIHVVDGPVVYSLIEQYSAVWVDNIVSICLPRDGHLESPSLLALTNNAAMNFHVQALVWTYVFISLGKVLKSGIAGLYSKFNFLRDYQTVFQRGQAIWHSHLQCMKVPLSPYPGGLGTEGGWTMTRKTSLCLFFWGVTWAPENLCRSSRTVLAQIKTIGENFPSVLKTDMPLELSWVTNQDNIVIRPCCLIP